MTTKWMTEPFSDKSAPPTSEVPTTPFDNNTVVLLLHGKNSFGDKIYSYLKITIANLQRLKIAVKAGQGFTASDFGEVVAAGKGDPSPELRAEMAATYPMVNPKQNAGAPPAGMPTEKKAWDEY